MKSQLVLFVFTVAMNVIAKADTIATPAQIATSSIKSALEKYAQTHNGNLPPSWKELDRFLLESEIKTPGQMYENSYLFRSVERSVGMPVERAFLLMGEERQGVVEMARPNPNEIFNGGTIIAVITSPVVEDRRKEDGRYVIWRDTDSNMRSSWLDESVAQTQFEKAGRSLPEGPVLEQPSALGPDGVFDKYSRENFKDPANPTAEEWENMKQDFAETSDKPAATPVATPERQESTPRPVPSAELQPSPTPTEAVETNPESERGFPIIPVAILAAAIVALTMFLLRRKSP